MLQATRGHSWNARVAVDVLPTPDTGGRREFEGALVRFLDDEAGARKTESQRAARTVFWFAISCVVLSVGYARFTSSVPQT